MASSNGGIPARPSLEADELVARFEGHGGLEPRHATTSRVRVGGWLLLAGSIAAIPATWADAADGSSAAAAALYAFAITGIAIGALYVLAPPSLISPAWASAGIAIATGLSAGVDLATGGTEYVYFYVITSLYAAYALDDPGRLLIYLALLVAALFLPVAFAAEPATRLQHALLALPALIVAPLIVADLRRTLARRERAYRTFALEATQLAARIRRNSGTRVEVNPPAGGTLTQLGD